MNAVVQFDSSVPAFLRNANFLALNQKATAGLAMGAAPPRLSFKGSRFRYVSADGAETPVNDTIQVEHNGQMMLTQTNGTSIDVVVIDASDHVSKFYYDKEYDPNAEDMSPACFSDNGQGPSIRARNPQSLLCGNCPKNAWGSKISKFSGKAVKACGDVKKLALVPISNITGPAYMLGIPGDSLKSWGVFVDQVSKRGVPIPAIAVRVGFDPAAEYPKLTFNPVRYISEAEAAGVTDLFGSEEADEMVGRKDTAITALPGGTATQQGVQQQYQPLPGTPPAAPAFAPTPAPQPMQFAAPPAAPTPPFLGAAPAPTTLPQQAEAPAPQRRRRRTAAEMAAANAAPSAAVAQAMVERVQPAGGFAPGPAVAPVGVGTKNLNDLLNEVMGQKK